jgi:type IV pilus assembly protein PilA
VHRRVRLRRDEEGFSLVEVMVVVLIIAVLIAIAIPTFFGARDKANNRSAQSNIRNGYTSERIHYAGAQKFTDVLNELKAVEPSLDWVPLAATATPSPWQTGSVYVFLDKTGGPTDGTLTVAARSDANKCYYLREANPSAGALFATDAACKPLNDAALAFTTSTWGGS